ncbi:C6 zinc finger domain-containing protein [Colletotrichum falcatum]|nr:C6 zinc finger domain-containing protein [Colletotrichum falcatum]
MMVRTNTGLMTENLMRLYHDVMEGALSCWVTEQNCPYLPPLAKAARLPILADAPSSHSFTSSQPVSLPNRIYQRVVKLDKSLGSLGIKPLSSLEDRKATRALHLAIMAFTAQWAQGSQRSQERYHQRRMFAEDLLSSGFVEEFDATLQKSFWNQARRCLDDCAAIGSFKVALAELIFGLTQKHTDEPEWDADGLDQFLPGRGGGPGGGEGSLTASRVQRVLDEDGYLVYLERAARRLHVLKSRCESYERKEKEPGEEGPAGEDENAEGKATMKMVYWMAIMFDTLSAAITERPPTVSDEDSKESGGMQLAAAAGDGRYFSSISDDERWNDRYIIKRDPNLAPLRLPCSEEAIARELIDAAPVKVLLFRKITRIQNLSSRGASQSAVEDAIQEGLAVYRYWDATYRPMFQDCLQNHDTLPPKVQSWYVPLLGHWLLAVMIMADCVGLLDERGLSLPPRAEERAAAGAIDHLRRTGMWAVSDLARASTPRDDDAGRLASYHPAVSEGALLTEPWTMVLIRSFATAGRLFLDDAAGAGAGAAGGEPGGPLPEHGGRLDLLDRCEDCVKALWYLGRKSSISRQVAGILGAGLDAERSKAFGLGGGVAACDPLASFGPVCGL